MGMNVGCRTLAFADAHGGADVPVRVFYPTLAEERPVRLGPYAMDLALDGAPDGERLPLVAISHGMGGSPLVYRTLAAHLAGAGFVVALPEHPGDNAGDHRLSGTAVNLENRPRHLRLAIDGLFADAVLGRRLRPGEARLIGHSLGGYTVLALAGGRPTCFAAEAEDGRPHAIPVTPDPRVKALVLLAPATVWFMAPGALAGVTAPILMLTGEKDVFTPPLHAAIVEAGVAGPVDHRVVAGAGHFAFLSPFPPEMVRPGFLPSQDPEGFDRARFVPDLNAQVTEFLQGTL